MMRMLTMMVDRGQHIDALKTLVRFHDMGLNPKSSPDLRAVAEERLSDLLWVSVLLEDGELAELIGEDARLAPLWAAAKQRVEGERLKHKLEEELPPGREAPKAAP